MKKTIWVKVYQNRNIQEATTFYRYKIKKCFENIKHNRKCQAGNVG